MSTSNQLTSRFVTSLLLIYIHVVFRRVRKIAKRDYKLRHICLSVRLFSAWKNSAAT